MRASPRPVDGMAARSRAAKFENMRSFLAATLTQSPRLRQATCHRLAAHRDGAGWCCDPEGSYISGMGERKDNLPQSPGRGDVDSFIRQVQAMPQIRPGGRGRLIFAMDATASREPSWDRACHIQGQMFETTASLGGLEVQLVFYRGFRECKASRGYADGADLHRAMRSVS